MDIAFLDRVFTECEEMKQLLDRHPALEPIAGRMMGLYRSVTTRAGERAEAGVNADARCQADNTY